MVRTIFMGTASIACPTLRTLTELENCEIAGVVTQPDRPKGRELKSTPSAVKACTISLGLPVWQPDKARDSEFILQLERLRPDLIVVMAYGQILPPSLLAIPRLGCLNLHTSLLPRHRGAAPIQWALLEGDAVTGVSLMRMDEGLDTGPVVATVETVIGQDEDASALHERLGLLAAELLARQLPGYVAGTTQASPQDHARATYARKLRKEDGKINWQQEAEAIRNRIRAFSPWPGAYTSPRWPSGSSLVKIWKAQAKPRPSPIEPGKVAGVSEEAITVACGQGSLEILELQKEGGRRMTARQFLAGHHVEPGQRWGD